MDWKEESSYEDNTHMFDTDGISFVIDNYATCIIWNDRTQFVGNLKVRYCGVETSVGVGTAQYVGTILIILTDSADESNAYDISVAIFDTDYPLNIIGIPYLSDFFGKMIQYQTHMMTVQK